MNPNTIILKKGEKKELTPAGYKRFQKGDTIFGENSNPGGNLTLAYRTKIQSPR